MHVSILHMLSKPREHSQHSQMFKAASDTPPNHHDPSGVAQPMQAVEVETYNLCLIIFQPNNKYHISISSFVARSATSCSCSIKPTYRQRNNTVHQSICQLIGWLYSSITKRSSTSCSMPKCTCDSDNGTFILLCKGYPPLHIIVHSFFWCVLYVTAFFLCSLFTAIHPIIAPSLLQAYIDASLAHAPEQQQLRSVLE